MKSLLTEEQVQRSIIDLCELLGYDVLKTPRHGITCKACGEKAYGGDGATKGLPDLFVRYPSWTRCMWVGMEVKRTGGKWSSPEQKNLFLNGMICRVESLEDAAFALSHFDATEKVFSALRQIWTGNVRPGVFV